LTAYEALRTPRRARLRVRGLDLHLRRWGPDPTVETPLVLLLHGWQDTGDTFQFMVDHFAADWPLAAADWRGFGQSAWPQEGYWFPDYYADLDALLDQLSPHAPVSLVGHSMGGNIAALYAGLRPERVRCVVNLEGFGLPRTTPQRALEQARKWLVQVKEVPPLKDYESFERLASVIAARYPRFSMAQAAFIAKAWANETADGRVRLLGDSRHRWVSAMPYRRDEAEVIWRASTAPHLLVLADESEYLASLGADGTDEALRATFPHLEIAHVAEAGHMLHIERAATVAALVEKFLGAHRPIAKP
jgi:pimeloyl-ACP methyl ester carboxylesterase